MSDKEQAAAAVERAMKLQAGTVLAREVDRLRAELAETRAAGDALAEALNDLLVQLPGYMGPTAARPEREAAVEADNAWRSVRGDAPAEPLHEWRCPGCGTTTRARMADAPAEPPAVELPVTLSSVDGDTKAWPVGAINLDVEPATLCGKHFRPGYRCAMPLREDLRCPEHGQRVMPDEAAPVDRPETGGSR